MRVTVRHADREGRGGFVLPLSDADTVRSKAAARFNLSCTMSSVQLTMPSGDVLRTEDWAHVRDGDVLHASCRPPDRTLPIARDCRSAAAVRTPKACAQPPCVASSRSCVATFLRMPKTGSTATFHAITDRPVLRRALCSSQGHTRLTDALRPSKGLTPPPQRIFVVALRHPLDRFRSLYRFSYADFGQTRPTSHFHLGRKYPTIDSLVGALTTDDAPQGQAATLRRTLETAEVWKPMSYWIPLALARAHSARIHYLCVAPQRPPVHEQLAALLRVLLGEPDLVLEPLCDENQSHDQQLRGTAEGFDAPSRAAIGNLTRLYAEDLELWRLGCGSRGGAAPASGEGAPASDGGAPPLVHSSERWHSHRGDGSGVVHSDLVHSTGGVTAEEGRLPAGRLGEQTAGPPPSRHPGLGPSAPPRAEPRASPGHSQPPTAFTERAEPRASPGHGRATSPGGAPPSALRTPSALVTLASRAPVAVAVTVSGLGASPGGYYHHPGESARSLQGYLNAALRIGSQLDELGSTVDRVAITAHLAPAHQVLLAGSGWNVLDFTPVPSPDGSGRLLSGVDMSCFYYPLYDGLTARQQRRPWNERYTAPARRSDGVGTYLKLLVFALGSYARVLHVDLDVKLHESPDPWLLRLPPRLAQEGLERVGHEGSSAAPPIIFGAERRPGLPLGKLGGNTHIFYARPSNGTLRMLLTIANEGCYWPWTNSEQDLVESVFQPSAPMYKDPRYRSHAVFPRHEHHSRHLAVWSSASSNVTAGHRKSHREPPPAGSITVGVLDSEMLPPPRQNTHIPDHRTSLGLPARACYGRMWDTARDGRPACDRV